MFNRIRAWVEARNAPKRSLVKRADFLVTIGLLLIVIGSDYAINGRYLISDAYLYGQQLFDPQLIGVFSLAVGVFVIAASRFNKPGVMVAAFGLAAAPITFIASVYLVIALVDGIHAVGFRALLFIVLLRFVWLSAAIVDLPDREAVPNE